VRDAKPKGLNSLPEYDSLAATNIYVWSSFNKVVFFYAEVENSLTYYIRPAKIKT